MKQKPEVTPVENEDKVELKPIMGIRPGIYLTVLYSVILLLVIFFLMIYPGIKSPVAALVVKTQPAGAAIRVNNVYMGISGSRILVPKGTQTIEAVMPGFESKSEVHEIPSRIFGSKFFPRRYKINITLETANPQAAFALYAADYATWSFGGEPTETWQVPMSLSEGAYRTGYMKNQGNKEDFEQILLAASRFTVTRAAARDLIRAKALLDNSGNAPSPVSLLGSISDTLIFLSENPGSALWLTRLLPPDVTSAIRTSAWAGKEQQSALLPDNSSQSRFTLAGLNFVYKNNNNFMISENPVPQVIFERFLNENPEWREHQINYIPEEITAITQEAHNREFITGVTWFAADAFCKWLTKQLPSSMANMEIRLPTENEWEHAAVNMSNAGWEWCDDPFAPLNFIKVSDKAINMVSSPERSLRGRQTANSAETRTSLPPEFSSPFVTFRPVIAAKR